jgi:hypothetical protein
MYGALAVGVVVVILGIALKVQSSRLEQAKAEIQNYKVAGELAKKEADRKDKLNADNIKTAVGERDDALAKLRAKSTHPSRVSGVPAAPVGSSEVCFPTAVYNAAFAGFGQAIDRRLADANRDAIEGDAAQIDAQTLLKGWPK